MKQNDSYIEIPVEDIASAVIKGNVASYMMQLKRRSDNEQKAIKVLMGGLLSLPLSEAIDVSTCLSSRTNADIASRVILSGMTPEIRDIMDLSRRTRR